MDIQELPISKEMKSCLSSWDKYVQPKLKKQIEYDIDDSMIHIWAGDYHTIIANGKLSNFVDLTNGEPHIENVENPLVKIAQLVG